MRYNVGMNAQALKRRWFRFGLRTLFVIVTVFGCWLGYQVNWIRQRHSALASGVVQGEIPNTPYVLQTTTAPRLLWLFGETGYKRLLVRFFGVEPSQAERDKIKELFPEAAIWPYHPKVDD
jgi:hypothetical protein